MISTDIKPEEKLLSAVVALAIDDACLPPIKVVVKGGKKVTVMCHTAYTAYRFLFFDGDGYYAALNMDPVETKKRLMSQLTDLSTTRPFSTTKRTMDIIGRRKRMFKINHKLYIAGQIRGNFKEEINIKTGEGDDDDDV
jgi:hypothetical protein